MSSPPKPLAQRCLASFPRATRRRGEALFEKDRVDLQELLDRGIWAKVRTLRGNRIELVDLGWRDARRGLLVGVCSCQFFEDTGQTCEHLWATLLEFDEQGLARHVPGTASLRVMEDFDFEPSKPLPPPAKPTNPAKPTKPPAWKQCLSIVRESAAGPRDSRSPGNVDTTRQRLAWFLIERGAESDGSLRVHFYRQDERASGGWGKLKTNPVSPAEVATFDPEDRELLGLLLAFAESDTEGRASTSGYSWTYSGWDRNTRQRSVALPPPLFESVLPRLCASGRFGWLVEEADTRRCETLRFEPEPPWRLVIEGEHAESRTRLRGGLVRDGEHGEERPPTSTRYFTRSGWIFFDDRIGRLERPDEAFPWILALYGSEPFELSLDEMPLALEEMGSLPGLPPLRLPEELDWPVTTLEPEPCVACRFEEGKVLGRAAFAYGSRRVEPADDVSGWPDPEGRRLIRRDARSEAARLEELSTLFPRRATRGEIEFAAEAFAESIDALREQGWRVEAEGRPLRSGGHFSAQVTSGVDWFELSGSMDFDDQVVEWPELLAAARHQQRFVPLGDGTVGLLPEAWLERFAPLARMAESKKEEKADSLRFERHQALLLDALLAAEPEVQVDEIFGRLREKLRNFDGLPPAEAPETFEGTLRPYQAEGLAWMAWLDDLHLGGCLADDMGLGKTIQVLAYLETRRLDGSDAPSLLVVPRSLLHNWHSEAARFTPALTVHVHHGPGRAERLDEALSADPSAAVVTTYGTLRRDLGTLREIDFDLVVLDEAQAIKNSASQTAKACRLVRGRQRLALTGTPVENHVGELWSLFEFLNTGMLGSLPALESMVGKTQLPPESVELVARAIRPLVLRRTKDQVLPDLPAKTEQTLPCELSTRERKRYDQLLGHYRARLGDSMHQSGLGRSKIQVLEALLRLRQAACHAGLLDADRRGESSAKLDVLLDRLRELAEEGAKALVFSQFTRFLAIVRDRLDREGLTYEYLDGRTRDRQAKVDRFQEDPDCSLFLISLKAGGTGLNLTAARYVFLLDPWWNPAVEAQAIDRAHRIGQDQPVFAYRLIARDTVEEKIVELQESKRALADAIVSQDRRLMRQLTAEDLALLLGGPLEG